MVRPREGDATSNRSSAEDTSVATVASASEDIGRRLQERDPRALEDLYLAYGRRAFGLAYRIVGDGGAAEDVLQESFLALWRQAGEIDTRRGRVESLLMTIVHRRAIDHARHTARRESRQSDVLLESLEIEADQLLQLVEDELTYERVHAALRTLPSEQREIIEMAYFEGLSQSEISRATGMALGTVKSRTRLAMEKLRAAFGIDSGQRSPRTGPDR